MTLHEYLMSEQAREDVRRIIAHGEMHGKQPHRFLCVTKHLAWSVVTMSVEGESLQAFYRPDGDRYIVTDLGEGVRALRLKGCAGGDANGKLREVLGRMWRENFFPVSYAISELINGEIGTPYRVSATDLPDALCRVMLASLRVAEVSP